MAQHHTSLHIEALVLEEVHNMGPITVAEIVANIGVSESTVRRTLRQLEKTGMVESETYQRRARVFMCDAS